METEQSMINTQQRSGDRLDGGLQNVDMNDPPSKEALKNIKDYLNNHKDQFKTRRQDDGYGPPRNIVRVSIELFACLLLANAQPLLQNKEDHESLERANVYLETAIVVAQEIQEPVLLTRCCFWHGVAAFRAGNIGTAAVWFEAAKPIIDMKLPESSSVSKFIQKTKDLVESDTQQAENIVTANINTRTRVATSRLHNMNMQSESARNTLRGSRPLSIYKDFLKDAPQAGDRSSIRIKPHMINIQKIKDPKRSSRLSYIFLEGMPSLKESTENFQGSDTSQERARASKAERANRRRGVIMTQKQTPDGRKTLTPLEEVAQSTDIAESRMRTRPPEQEPDIDAERIQHWVSDISDKKLPPPNSPSNTEGSGRERRSSSVQAADQIHRPPSPQTRRLSESMSAKENLFEADISRPNSVAKPNLRIDAQIAPVEEGSRRLSSTPTVQSPLREVSLVADSDDEEA